MSRPSANEVYRAAQALIRAGQPVFPCWSHGAKAKAPMTRNGVKDATLDVGQVKRWWSQHKDAALGIPTGVKYDVLDVDVKRDADGRVHLPRLTRLGLLNGCERVARTPSGGYHLFFPASPAGVLSNRAHALLGLDVRSHGGYVLASPSYIEVEGDEGESGYEGAYADLGATEGSNGDLMPWDAIVSALAPVDTDTRKPIELLGYERQSSLASLRGWLSERVAGERNNALHWAVCRCIENGIDPHELLEVALMIGLGEDETLLTMRSAMARAGVAHSDLKSEAEALFD